MPDRSTRCGVLLLALAAGSAHAAPAVGEVAPREAFVIESPHAAQSRAQRVTWGWSQLGRAAQTEPGWWVLGRVLVRAEPGVDANAIARAAGAAVRDVRRAPVEGWWVLRTRSVDAALRAARRLERAPGVLEARPATQRPWSLRALPNDPLLEAQWNLVNTVPGEEAFDANLDGAWAQGFTGAGVQIGIVELGFGRTHEDLAPGYRADLSQPPALFTSHGSSVAGIAAARGHNGVGVAGAAHQAELAESFFGSDEETAAALLFANDQIDVKNCSFGPTDDNTIHLAGPMELDALRQAAEQGRGGLGTIIVWAAGNGGELSPPDRVDYDPFASSRYTIAVNSIDDDDDAAAYAEPGSSVLVATHSSGDRRAGNRGVTTTAGTSSYTSSFGGTSAAAPLAAGVVALMLEANPALSWRDVQHVLVESARRNDPGDPAWTPNGAGRFVHPYHGFGAIDAGAAVALAQTWSPVAPAISVSASVVFEDAVLLPDNTPAGATRTLELPAGVTIEHVELTLDVESDWQGDLRIELISPAGTVSTLAVPRAGDGDNTIAQRVFTSVRCWGEGSGGLWSVRLADERAGFFSLWSGMGITVHGTASGCGPADLTGEQGGPPDGIVSVADFTAFLDLWLAGDPSADLTATGGCEPGAPDGSVDISDYACYLTLWAAGCP